MRWSFGSNGYWSAAYARICVCNMLVFFAFQMILPTLPVYVTDMGSDGSSARARRVGHHAGCRADQVGDGVCT